ncbi:hypothetical protein F4804DRAFT_309462 [Jackrogersella minutella]|nr:hypothetical protein F4804DRAFT_309462 [Jackrogersella minutella]
MKLTSLIPIIFSFCLWPTANALPSPDFTAPLPKYPRLGHRVGAIAYPRKPLKLTHAAILRSTPQMNSNNSANGTDAASGFTSLPSPANSTSNTTLTSYCKARASTFVDATVATSPPASDCAVIADRLVPQLGAGFFHYDAADLLLRNTTGMKRLHGHGACAFGVAVGDLRAENITTVRIGTADVVGVIAEAVRRFANGTGNATAGRLDAAGAFECGEAGTMVNWALYHA